MKRIITLVVLIIGLVNVNIADEGMWIPLLLEKYNIEDMQTKGFKLSAEDIYSINQDCLMDAVVIFGSGCTGDVVSDKGLLLTNHHCGFGEIQNHSSIENDYLTDGFWAMNMKEELPNDNLSVKFLKRIEDVTEKIMTGVSNDLTEEERQDIIKSNIDSIKKIETADNHYSAKIKPFFYGNQYYMFIYEEYKDIRLVGAPPSAIGKFGGDTDNWMWPRHTGDFSIFRIYADKDNNPAEYSEENVPYTPKRFLPISVKGINEVDFTWVMGYPGSTQEYLISDAIEQILDVRNPNRIQVRDARLEIMNRYAEMNDTIRIKYADKKRSASNSWKRWKGEIVGLNRLKTVEKKKTLETEFQNWAMQNNKSEYLEIIPQLSKLYSEIEEYAVAYDYWKESIRSIEVIRFASRFDKLIKLTNDEGADEKIEKELKKLQTEIDKFYKDYVQDIDQEIFTQLLPLYYNNVNTNYIPSISEFDINNVSTYTEKLYGNSIFLNETQCRELIKNDNKDIIKAIETDPVYIFYKSFADIYNEVKPKYDSLNNETKKLYRSYVKGLQEMNANKTFYPDANFTMRVSYGNIQGFSPRDGVDYEYYTTIDGVIEKDNPQIYDYDVPQKLIDIYKAKDFGKYQQNGTVPVCFIATNHTTGGNSGSPVLDAEGNLIGLNFDRAWNGIMSDMMFDPERSRNVTLDIRYLLFIVDKFAGAGHLVDEMKIIE